MSSVFLPTVLATDTTAKMEKFASGTLYFAIAGCVVAICSRQFSGPQVQGPKSRQELTGKKGLIIAVTAAFLLGSIPAIMGFLDVAFAWR